MTNLIPLQYLNEVCFLSLNEDDKKYQMVLELAQDQLKTIIGKPFFEELAVQYSNKTLSTDNDLFYEQSEVKKYLAWQTYFYYLKFANVNNTPTGLREFNDENSSVLTDVKMYAAEKNILQILNKYKGDFLTFLSCAKSADNSKYPLYVEKCREDFSFGITSINKHSDEMFKVNKTILTNE